MTNEMQTQWNSSWLDSGNQSYLDHEYEIFLKNPAALNSEWNQSFQSISSGNQQGKDVSHADVREYFKNLSYSSSNVQYSSTNEKLIDSYRLLGHLQSNINPIASSPPPQLPELSAEYYGLQEDDVRDLQAMYCGQAAIEYMHILDTIERTWLQQNYEEAMLATSVNRTTKAHILELLIAADGLEKYLGAKYPGAKRFSLEGCDSLIVGIDEIITYGGEHGVEEIIIAMTHRGRLNLLVNLLGQMPSELFDLFEDKHNLQLESGDVKYHQGFASDIQTTGGNVHLSLIFNPSHLAIVAPVATGSVQARQERRNGNGREKVMCVAIHGDAAFAGQGVVMETLNMSGTRGYSIGGTIHVIVNNQIGFTTSNPHDARSTLYCTDLGKMLPAPILHVNADDPEAVLKVFNLAIKYRMQFQKDIIIDLVGYRRMGHNEADEPAATQPLMYKIIRSHPPVNELYAKQLIAQHGFTAEEIDRMRNEYRETLDQRDHAVVKRLTDRDWRNAYAADWRPYGTRDWRIPTSTKVPLAMLQELANLRDQVPNGFVLDARVEKIVEARQKMTLGEMPVDWGYAETLAYATLLNEGYNLRLSGQDSGRGTFFHRHAVWHEQNTDEAYISLQHLNVKQGKCWIIDSLLSEAGVLGFEYGYSTSEPRTLTIWEAQFGDFANNAQVVIDQFISSGEQKWGRLSGLVMLLPHGYEGQGPEHSSARIERYLQLCAQHNMQVCIPSTPAQIYHLLRRQMLRPMRKPLVVITPKSLLRNKDAVSTLDELANGSFQVIISDLAKDYAKIDRVILCSGKVYYGLLAAKQQVQQQAKHNVAIIRMEQLYPFPEEELAAELHNYVNAKDVVWCQEEPRNQGTWYSMQHHFREALLPTQNLIYAGRSDSAAPAVGSLFVHEQQQKQLVQEALGEV